MMVVKLLLMMKRLELEATALRFELKATEKTI